MAPFTSLLVCFFVPLLLEGCSGQYITQTVLSPPASPAGEQQPAAPLEPSSVSPSAPLTPSYARFQPPTAEPSQPTGVPPSFPVEQQPAPLEPSSVSPSAPLTPSYAGFQPPTAEPSQPTGVPSSFPVEPSPFPSTGAQAPVAFSPPAEGEPEGPPATQIMPAVNTAGVASIMAGPLYGFSYFGFNNQGTMVNGLWSGSALALDFGTIVYRQKLLGFNSVRLPFSFYDLYSLKPQNIAQPCTFLTDAQVAASVLLPGETLPSIIPTLTVKPNHTSGLCNGYIPSTSVLDRFLWVVKFYIQNGFKVLIDDHREDSTVLTNPTLWVQYWATLAQKLASDPVINGNIIFDILNEPDGFGIRWEGSSGKPALTDLYIQAMDAIETEAPGQVFAVEGTGQGGIQTNWGDGFATNSALIKKYGLSDPTRFFNTLITKPYARRVLISPHVYGPGVTYNKLDSSGTGLWTRLSESFGYLNKAGYGGITFPIAIGEFGSKFTDVSDTQTMLDLAQYINNAGGAADGLHNPIKMWYWWDWNANSGDTGGLVGDDWTTIETVKIKYLRTIGLPSLLAH